MRFFKKAGLMFPEIDKLSPETVMKLQRKRKQFSIDLKNPKFRAKAKLKDYKEVLGMPL